MNTAPYLISFLQAVYELGYVRNKKDHSLLDIRNCSSKIFQKSTLAFICPPTSIILGVSRLKNTFSLKHNNDSLLQKIYFAVTGIISILGLGVIIVSIRLSIFFITYIMYLIINMFHILSSLSKCIFFDILALPLEYSTNLLMPPLKIKKIDTNCIRTPKPNH